MAFIPVREFGHERGGLVADWACDRCRRVLYPRTHIADVPRGTDPCSDCMQALNQAEKLAEEWGGLEEERRKARGLGLWSYRSDVTGAQGFYGLRDDLAYYLIRGETSKALQAFAKRLGKPLPEGPKLSGAARDKIRIGDLPEDMQVLLGQFAQDTEGFPMGNDGDFERFKKVELPVFMVPLENFPDLPKEPWDDREFEDYLDTPIEEFPPVVIAHGMFVDGGHRLWAARKKGVKAIQTVDASSIFKESIRKRNFNTLGPMKESHA